MTARRIVASMFIAGLTATTFLAAGGCDSKSDAAPSAGGNNPAGAKPPEAVPVVVRPAVTEPIVRTVEIVGTLWGDEDTTVSAKVAGRVTDVFKDVGDRVPAGAELAQIDKRDYELAEAQRELAVKEQLARLGLTDLPGPEFDPASIPTVQRAKLQAANAEARFRRSKELFDQRPPVISEQDYEDARTAAEVARSEHDVELLSARALATAARSRAADAAVAAQALADATVRAPAGQTPVASPASTAPATAPAARTYAVAQRLVSVGEYVREGTPLFRLVADDPVKFRGQIPERFGDQIRVGQRVTLGVESHPGKSFDGVVSRLSPQIDPASRTFQVEALIPNPHRHLKPGAFARAHVGTRTDERVVFVPREAVVTFAGTSKVFTIDPDGKAREHVVEVGVPRDGRVEVVKGLDEAVPVVVEGGGRLARGVPVAVKDATAPTTGEAVTGATR
ncbi:MAG TPA: efflux RND transporter periplasmic adaptor subunit [Tepidisphaeraceae bacterium]|nr:efflux RND transporter periplasmic adaptor subunit [Tepidisphaeraceae bacterium]